MVLSDLRNQGKEIILVSSGAQGIALGKLGLAEKAERYKRANKPLRQSDSAN